MKRAKLFNQLTLLLCLILLLMNSAMPVNAFERKDHDKYMEQVLFKNFKEIDNDPTVQNEIDVLESAAYLNIDQFNGSGQKDLDVLIKYGVKEIPSTIDEISFNASGKTHRNYSHRGWDYFYGGIMTEIWPKRQAVLRNSVNTIFDFQGDEEKAEAFCEMIYYIHILGDHMDDESWKVQNGLKMEVGGRIDKYDVIHELIDCFEVLFDDQSHTHKYSNLMNTLERYNTKFAKIVRSEGGINTDEKFELHQEYVKNLMNVLTYYLPEMLKDEAFFSEVFYK